MHNSTFVILPQLTAQVRMLILLSELQDNKVAQLSKLFDKSSNVVISVNTSATFSFRQTNIGE